MTWVTYRQHRWPLLLGALLVVALAAVLAGLGGSVRELATALGQRVADCSSGRLPVELARVSACPSLKELPNFVQVHRVIQLVILVLPAAGGMFVGAPLLAQELEQRTNEFAWTQSVTRRRWLLAKLGLLALATAGVSGLAAALVRWWERPILDAGLMDGWAWFGHGLALPVYALFAFALGVAVGALLRRTVATMATTLALYAAVRLGVNGWWRPRFAVPVDLVAQREDQLTGTDGAWILKTFLADAGGRRLSPEQETEIFNTVRGVVDGSFMEVLARRGVREHVLYHPVERLASFELLEAGIFAALAALLVGFAVWWVGHRAT